MNALWLRVQKLVGSAKDEDRQPSMCTGIWGQGPPRLNLVGLCLRALVAEWVHFTLFGDATIPELTFGGL